MHIQYPVKQIISPTATTAAIDEMTITASLEESTVNNIRNYVIMIILQVIQHATEFRDGLTKIN